MAVPLGQREGQWLMVLKLWSSPRIETLQQSTQDGSEGHMSTLRQWRAFVAL